MWNRSCDCHICYSCYYIKVSEFQLHWGKIGIMFTQRLAVVLMPTATKFPFCLLLSYCLIRKLKSLVVYALKNLLLSMNHWLLLVPPVPASNKHLNAEEDIFVNRNLTFSSNKLTYIYNIFFTKYFKMIQEYQI